MEYKKLSSKAISSWIVSRIIGNFIFFCIVFLAIYFLKEKFEISWVNKYFLYIKIIVGIIMLLAIINTFFEPFFEYKQWKYLINEDKIDFTEGIYFTKNIIIPIVRIQHIEVMIGPINKFFDLATIEIHTASGSHKIPNIKHDEAKKISENLKDKINMKVNQYE